jgi:hypothetical protein
MKTKSILNRIAAILAFIIGVMAIFAGGKVILSILPEYYVIVWLPFYNFVVGIVSAFFTAIIIWKDSRLSMSAALTTFSLHAIVMMILQTAYRGIVAPDSTMAMTVRLIVWAIILTLLFIHYRKIKKLEAWNEKQ